MTDEDIRQLEMIVDDFDLFGRIKLNKFGFLLHLILKLSRAEVDRLRKQSDAERFD